MTYAIILVHIKTFAPEVLAATAKDSSCFHGSEEYIRKFLYAHLYWVPHKSTHAVQKILVDTYNILWEMFLCLVLTLNDCGIQDASLFIYFDQLQIVVANTGSNSFTVEGTSQVGVVGKEGKQAWTSVAGVAASGEVLLMQIVMQGKTAHSLPALSALHMNEAERLGFLFSLNSDTYNVSILSRSALCS